MSKSKQIITATGASASPSESTQKELDTEPRFIDDLMGLLLTLTKLHHYRDFD